MVGRPVCLSVGLSVCTIVSIHLPTSHKTGHLGWLCYVGVWSEILPGDIDVPLFESPCAADAAFYCDLVCSEVFKPLHVGRACKQ